MVEKAVSTLGEAPQGLRDVFELCRGFEKAFSNVVNVGSAHCLCSVGSALHVAGSFPHCSPSDVWHELAVQE